MDDNTFEPCSGIFRVNGEFTIYQVQQVRSQLLEAKNTGALRAVDLSKVTEFDSAALQLLLSLRGGVAFVGQNDQVTAVLELLDLRQNLPVSSEAAS